MYTSKKTVSKIVNCTYRDTQKPGHNALLLQQIAVDLLHALSYRHGVTWHSLCYIQPWRHWLDELTTCRLRVNYHNN